MSPPSAVRRAGEPADDRHPGPLDLGGQEGRLGAPRRLAHLQLDGARADDEHRVVGEAGVDHALAARRPRRPRRPSPSSSVDERLVLAAQRSDVGTRQPAPAKSPASPGGRPGPVRRRGRHGADTEHGGLPRSCAARRRPAHRSPAAAPAHAPTLAACSSRPSPSTPARSPTRPPARSSRRSTRCRPTSRTASAGCAAATSTAAARNPTRTALEECLAALEGGRRGLAFASGLAAEDTLLRAVCRPGDHVVIPDDAYGGTYRLFARVARRVGPRLHARRPDTTSTRIARRSARAAPRSCGSRRRPTRCSASPTSPRSPSSPTTPARCSSSTTPSRRPTSSSRCRSARTSSCTRRRSTWAATPTSSAARSSSPTTSSASRSPTTRTRWAPSPARSTRGWCCAASRRSACAWTATASNAERIVEVLTAHPTVTEVLYPGLPDHPGHEIAAKQMKAFGGMVSFRVAGGEEEAVEVCNRTEVFILGESLGGVESLIEHPGRMTHASVAGSPLEVPGRPGAALRGHRVGRRPRRGPHQGARLGGRAPSSASTSGRPSPRQRSSTRQRALLGDGGKPDHERHRRHGRRRRLPRRSWDVAATSRCSPARAPGAGCGWPSSATSAWSPPRRVTGSGLSAGARVVHVAAGSWTARTSPRLRGQPAGRAAARRRHRRRQRRGAAAQRGRAGRQPAAVPVVVAGNVDARDEVVALLRDGGKHGRPPPPTCCPSIGRLDPHPAREAIRDVFIQHVIGGKGLSRRADFPAMVRAATPDAVLAGVEVLADGAGDVPGVGDVLVVDVGGATTDVYSVVTPQGEDAVLRKEVVEVMWRSRTVEGDLGMRWSAGAWSTRPRPSGWSLPGEERIAARGGRAPRTPTPAFLAGRRGGARDTTPGWPSSPSPSPCAGTAAAARTCARSRWSSGPAACCGTVRREPRAQVLRPATADLAGGWPVPEHARTVVDVDYVLAAAGLLARTIPRPPRGWCGGSSTDESARAGGLTGSTSNHRDLRSTT